MKKAGKWFSFLLLIFILSGCGAETLDTGNRIVAPKNNLIPIEGKWTIETCVIGNEDKAMEKSDYWIGKTAQFSKDAIAVGDMVSENIVYKMKRVNVEEYFLHKFKGPIDKLGIKGNETQVITVSSEDKFLFEFIKVSDDRIIANIDNEFFCLKKISDKVEETFAGEILNRSVNDTARGNEERLPVRSGILLGLRTPVKAENNSASENSGGYSYRTLWIAYDDGEVRPVLEAKDLFLPRMNGFWKLMVREQMHEGIMEDVLTAYSISKGDTPIIKESSKKEVPVSERNGVIRKAIQYAGNDYVTIENVGSGIFKDSKKSWQYNQLQVLPVDNISNSAGVKISDIAGENGSMAMERAINNLLESSDGSNTKDLSNDKQEQSFGLYRKTGHWFMKGRMEFQQKAQVPFVDFNINLIPPTDFVAYDILQVPWTNIKDRVPNAVDAFTSPNSDVAIIVTKEQILIYKISGNGLAESPIRKITLNKGDSIVMAEWASGYYVNRWESIFMKNNEVSMVK